MDYRMCTYTGSTKCDSISLDELADFISKFQELHPTTINSDDYFIAVNPGNLPLDKFFELAGCLIKDPSLPKRTAIFGFDVYIDRVLPVGTYKICPKLTPELTLKLGGIGDKSIEIIEE